MARRDIVGIRAGVANNEAVMDQEHIDFRNFNLAHIRQYLRKTDFPAPREEIAQDLRRAGATDVEVDVANNLPNRLYTDLDDALKAMNILAGLHQGSAQSDEHVRRGGKVHSDGPYEMRQVQSRNEVIEDKVIEGEHPGHIPRLRHGPRESSEEPTSEASEKPSEAQEHDRSTES
jgi:hypothetical protein